MSSAADMFAQSLVDMVRSEKELQEARARWRASEQNEQAWAEAAKDIAYLEDAVARNLAEKYALRQQLERYAPDHPLIKNQQLLEKIRELGARAFAINRNFDDSRTAGATYFPPGLPPIK